MKKNLALFVILIGTFVANGQETTTNPIGNKDLGNIYYGIFNRIKLPLYEEIRMGNIKAYSDDEMTKPIKVENISKMGVSYVSVKRQRQVEGVWKTYDTLISRPFDGNMINGFKWVKGNTGYKLFYKTYPDTSAKPGHPYCVVSWQDVAPYFGKTEMSVLKEFMANMNTPGAFDFIRKETISAYYGARLSKFKGLVYTNGIEGSVVMYEKTNFKRILPPQAALRIYGVEDYYSFFRVSGDSSTMYDSLVASPFPSDTIDGIIILENLNFDPTSGVLTQTIKGISPGMDPTASGGTFTPIEPTFWIKWDEAQKFLTPSDVQFLYELLYFQKLDKLNRNCD